MDKKQRKLTKAIMKLDNNGYDEKVAVMHKIRRTLEELEKFYDDNASFETALRKLSRDLNRVSIDKED